MAWTITDINGNKAAGETLDSARANLAEILDGLKGPSASLEIPDGYLNKKQPWTQAMGDILKRNLPDGATVFNPDPLGKESTGGATGFMSWLDPVRVATVILGLLMFGAGIFLLGKGAAVDIVKEAVT